VNLLRLLCLACLGAVCAGCAGSAGRGNHLIVFVAGVGGDGAWYGGLKRGIVESRSDGRIESFNWGAPLPLFALNFNSRSIHQDAERKLAARIDALYAKNSDAPIDIVAHSAGCGVTLGALALINSDGAIGDVILLAPSVSPGYDLAPALSRIRGTLHAFHSDRDTLFLAWRTSRFGTYDNVKTKAAGNLGFDLSRLPPELARRVVQHPYDPAWRELGNDGTHDGPLSRAFVARVVAPLLVATPATQP